MLLARCHSPYFAYPGLSDAAYRDAIEQSFT